MPLNSNILLRRAAALLGLIIVGGCSSATQPDRAALPNGIAAEAADFQTDSSSYTLRATSAGYEGVIGVTFTNRSDVTANFVNCGGATGVALQKLVGGEWTSVWSPAIPLCLSP